MYLTQFSRSHTIRKKTKRRCSSQLAPNSPEWQVLGWNSNRAQGLRYPHESKEYYSLWPPTTRSQSIFQEKRRTNGIDYNWRQKQRSCSKIEARRLVSYHQERFVHRNQQHVRLAICACNWFLHDFAEVQRNYRYWSKTSKLRPRINPFGQRCCDSSEERRHLHRDRQRYCQLRQRRRKSNLT